MIRWNAWLSLMIGACLLCAMSLHAEPDDSDYARLLNTYVADDGVRYAAWAKQVDDVSALKAFVSELGQTDLDGLSKDAQKAFYINLYNAGMLQAVLDHYPLKSVKSIGLLPFSVFKKKWIALGDDKVSLDHIEKGILLEEYFDARIHFAVNCASESCPPLRAEPFVGERLNTQLDEQTRLFADSGRAARVDVEKEAVAYSELFKWDADDFGVENPSEFLNRYRETDLPMDHSVGWIPYDWSLNAAKN